MKSNRKTVCLLSLAVIFLMMFLIHNYNSSLGDSNVTQNSLSFSSVKTMTTKDHLQGTTTRPLINNVLATKPLKGSVKDLTSDCMEVRKTQPYPLQGTSMKGRDLCAVFQGTSRTDCVYNHPEVFNFVIFTDHPDQSVLDFRAYLAIYSVHRFYKPDKVVIHCNYEIRSNIYWEKLKKLSTPLETKLTERIRTIGKAYLHPGFITHEVDYFKVMQAFKNGGIYADFDMVVLNGTRLREMQQRSEVILGRDDDPCSKTCAGFISCVPDSPLMRKWQESYENDYMPQLLLYNANRVPGNLLKSCTECYDVIVDPDISNWNEAANWREADKINWYKKPVAHYMNVGFMKPLKPVREILKMSNSFSEMVKHVLGDTVKDFEDLV